jgi:predicted ATPase/DNA-binding SARP family transcriptional activator
MEFRILGPLEVLDGERALPLGGPRRRALLALLLLHANEPVASDRLLEELWSDPGAKNALEAAVSRLRRGPLRQRLETSALGYVLRVESDELDAERFARLLTEGRDALAADAVRARSTLQEGLTLFRGDPLADFWYEPFAQGEIARLEELRLQALEERIEADLALRRHEAMVGELQPLLAANPLRERLAGQLMLALYRSGRQAQALETYRTTRETLLDQLGLEPGPELRELERAILQQEVSLQLSPLPRAPTAPARKLVTVLALELARSEEPVDPEAERSLTDRALALAVPVLARHGGRVVPSGRGQLLAALGLPALHEDDALRAARAALELQGELSHLGELGIGIATGELLVADPELLDLTGEAVEHSAALAGKAMPGMVLLDEETRRLCPAALELESSNGAWRLLAVRPAARPLPLRLETPFLGRDAEHGRLMAAFAESVADGSCRLVIVLGDAGIGKTRLAEEVAAALAERATVLSGRCLAYGEGITFWPLREILTQAGAAESSREQIAVLMPEEKDAELVADRLASALGLTEGGLETEEIFWAVRRLLEVLAHRRPLLVVLEDLHWAESAFLDLVPYLADKTSAPVLVLVLARPELLEARPAWAAERETIQLDRLPEDESALLLAATSTALAQSARARVLEAAEGNPLFLEQLAAWLAEHPAVEVERLLPPTIQALLAARLERLGPGERAVIERAAIIGKQFWHRGVIDLLPDEARPSALRHLQELIRKQLIRSDQASFPAGDASRFRHVLIQEAAYRSIPKRRRAELHERFVTWLEGLSGERASEYDEILGYHLEWASRYRFELEPLDEHVRALEVRAGERLASAGMRAFARGDADAASSLLGRAAQLLPRDDPDRLMLLVRVGAALEASGELSRAEEVLDEVVELAQRTGQRRIELRARLERNAVLERLRTSSEVGEGALLAEQAIPIFEAEGDDEGLARAWEQIGDVHWAACHFAARVEALERALVHAERAGDRRLEAEIYQGLALSIASSPTPVPQAIERCEQLLEGVHGQPVLQAAVRDTLAVLYGMQGRVEDARRACEASIETFAELGLRLRMGLAWTAGANVEVLAGDPVAAERSFRAGYELFRALGERNIFSTLAGQFANFLYAQGHYDEAARLAREAREATAPDDVISQILWRLAEAKLKARAGESETAERLAREAVELAKGTDSLGTQAMSLRSLAEVLRLIGRTDEAVTALEEALRLATKKQNVTAVAAIRALLDELAETVAPG